MKKLIAMLLCVVMVMGLSVTAFAAAGDPTTSITAPENGHTYAAYQIFAGDLADGKLSNIAWGTGITEAGKTALGDAAAKAETLKTKADAEAFAKAVAPYLATYTEIGSGKTVEVDAGYYLIKDKEAVTGDDVSTRFIIEVVGEVTISPKGDKPMVEKKVKDVNDSTGDKSGWVDSADHDVNDKVEFQLTGTLPSNYADYDQYYYEFHDTLSAGLTYNNDAKVYVVNGETKTEITSQADMTGAVSSIKIADLKKVTDVTISASSKIVVEYSATLNDKAVIGPAGNTNKVNLEYSNNPNQKGDGTTKPETGKTPDDTVIVFTYKIVVNKVDEKGKALTGAGFTLYKLDSVSGEYKAVGAEVKGDQMTQFVWNRVDDGKYKLVETTTPAGYNTIADQYFTVTAVHTDGDTPALTSINGMPATADSVIFSKKEAGAEVGTTSTDGTLTAAVENKQGSTLPETGGMGTTLFYVIGSLMVVGAGVLLVTKKRMSAM